MEDKQRTRPNDKKLAKLNRIWDFETKLKPPRDYEELAEDFKTRDKLWNDEESEAAND